MIKLDGQVALVTGGAAGLGKAIARRLAADGAKVVISDVQDDTGNATAQEHGFTFLRQDVCDEAQWIHVIQEVEQRCGRLSILVNNAGITEPTDKRSPANTRLEDWKRIFAVNVEGVFLGCRTAIASMRKGGGGSIINIASIAGLLANPFSTAYGASKAAVRHLTKSVAQYCAQEKLNIRCNSVHPGNVRTPLWERQAADVARARGVRIEEVFAELGTMVPLGDMTLPEDIAAAVAFLASDDARHITGAKLIVDGGIVNCSTYHFHKSGVARAQ